jgi:predicted  nucleic acid-binding Zn-ribbon protein
MYDKKELIVLLLLKLKILPQSAILVGIAGEVVQLQREVERWKQQRSSLSDEIMRLSAENEKFKRELDSLATLKSAFSDLQADHNAMLQMYGEKVEEVEELRMDIQDVKEMYKNQVGVV